LTANALKFTFHGSITLGARSDSVHPERIWFWVKDTGIGIKEQDIQNLFKMFGKLEDPQKINTQGVGLGLTISNNLVRLLNQNEEDSGIKVESKLDHGTTFSFYIVSRNSETPSSESSIISIPEEYNVTKGHQRHASHQITLTSTKTLDSMNHIKYRKSAHSYRIPNSFHESASSQLNINKKSDSQTVLLVDDNPFNFIFGKALLEKRGCKVLTAYNGKEAIKTVLQHNQEISFVLMDCQMPIMDGFEATRILKQKMELGEIRKFPIYALTANEIEQEKERYDQAKMDGYIRKPLNEAEVNKLLKSSK